MGGRAGGGIARLDGWCCGNRRLGEWVGWVGCDNDRWGIHDVVGKLEDSVEILISWGLQIVVRGCGCLVRHPGTEGIAWERSQRFLDI